MRAVLMIFVLSCLFCFPAVTQAETEEESRVIFEFALDNPSGEFGMIGNGKLSWRDCGGDVFGLIWWADTEDSSILSGEGNMAASGYTAFSNSELPLGEKVYLAFFAGNADLSLLETETYEALFCNPCEVSCCLLEDSACGAEPFWYLYESSLCLPDGVLNVRAWIPAGVNLELRSANTLGETPASHFRYLEEPEDDSKTGQ